MSDRDELIRIYLRSKALLPRIQVEMPVNMCPDDDPPGEHPIELVWVDDTNGEIDAILEWHRALIANAWDEGFDAGEKDVWEHERTSFETPCTTKPYRSSGLSGGTE